MPNAVGEGGVGGDDTDEPSASVLREKVGHEDPGGDKRLGVGHPDDLFGQSSFSEKSADEGVEWEEGHKDHEEDELVALVSLDHEWMLGVVGGQLEEVVEVTGADRGGGNVGIDALIRKGRGAEMSCCWLSRLGVEEPFHGTEGLNAGAWTDASVPW